MNKKHYRTLAEDWRKLYQHFLHVEQPSLYQTMIESFCIVAKQANPAFDQVKFKEACGLEPFK